MEPQPNFEKLKALFYQSFVYSSFGTEKAHLAVSMQSIRNADFRSHYTKWEEFKKDCHNWLNRLDIREAGTVIDVLIENKKPVPEWMKHKRYVIDYNKYDMLDLIILKDNDNDRM